MRYYRGMGIKENSKETNLSEAEIIREGSSSEAERLVKQHTEALLKGALSLGFPIDDAKDLVQSVWGTFFVTGDRFEGRSQVTTFLFGILYNKAKERRRVEARQVPDEHIDQLVDSYFDQRGRWMKPTLDPERFLQASQVMETIEDCLKHLPVAQRMAFCMREIDEHGTSEICKILEVSTTNLGVMLFRAKARLRECIERKAENSGEI